MNRTLPRRVHGRRLAGPFLALLFLLLLGLARAATAFDAPAFQGDVLDETGLLTEGERQALLERIRRLRDESGIWAAIYVPRALQGESIETAALATFERWKLGQAGKDNGLLVLVAPAERRMRIEVGYGLEGFITDAYSKRIIDEIYQPAFRQNRFSEGLLQGFEAMAAAARGEALAPPSPAGDEVEFDGGAFLKTYLIAIAANLAPPFLHVLARIYGRRQGRTAVGEETGKGMFIIFGFFGLFFGLFFAVFGQSGDDDPEVLAILIGMNALFASVFSLPFAAQARRYLSASAYRRWRARQRLLRMRGRSREKRRMFGVWFDPALVSQSEGGTKAEPRSSSSSSSNSGSGSSSGGGSSGGGGASGSW